MIVPVILSGGSGSRLWPLSRKHHPKQYLNLINNDSTLFQDTVLRLPQDIEKPLVICNEEHRFLVAEQLRAIGVNSCSIILEPNGKNTAPAVTLAALKFSNSKEDPILLVLSTDHLIQNNSAFHKAIEIGKTLAEQEKLVTFGVTPITPETGYGYIEIKKTKSKKYDDIKSFIEKPSLDKAKSYIDSRNYYWNSGIFMFKASVYLKELDKFEPEIFKACKKSLNNSYRDLDFLRINKEEFNKCPEKSIDYAVMENTSNGAVVKLDTQWKDLGSWSTLWDYKTKDGNGNVTEGDVILEAVNDTYAVSSNRLITALGVSGLVIIDTPDALLISDKKYVQNIKNIVEKLTENNRSELDNHRQVFRPWGYYDSIDSGNGFQVKRILVNPGAQLSLQKHKYRSEHWVVVKGVAQVTCAEKVFELKENQSTYIPQGTVHRLRNNGDTPLEIIEIQTGSYLEEDDIIRLEDDYQRN